MSENGTENRRSLWREVTEQLADHVDLAALELRYETQEAGKRVIAVGVVLILGLTGFIVLQVAIISALMRAGLTLWMAAIILSMAYFGLAVAIFWILGRRDKRAGPPFIHTQKEIRETLRWIQKILS